MRVGYLLRPRAAVELAADVGELLAHVEVEMNLAVAEEVVHCVVCPCAKRLTDLAGRNGCRIEL